MLFPARSFYPGLGSWEEEEEAGSSCDVPVLSGFLTAVGVGAGPCQLHKHFLLRVDLTIQIKRACFKNIQRATFNLWRLHGLG